MTITVTGDLVLDENAGLQNPSNPNDSDDDDLSWSSFQSALSSTLYSRLFTAGGLNLATNTTDANAFPQVAWQTGLISLSSPVDDLRLVKNSTGDTYDGVDSGWQDLAGNHIFLYADSNSNIVLGRAGTGAVANPSGAIDMALVLDEHLTSGKVSSADLYQLQFTALKEPIANAVDDADVLDLTNKVYLASFTSNTVAFNDFSKVPSGSDNWTIIQPSSGGSDPDILVTALVSSDTVEVSTQGLGEGSQALNQFEGLRFDMVNGGAGGAGPSPDPLTNPQVHDDTKIAYTAHQLGSGGGFTITQVNPGSSNTTVSLKIGAFDAAGDFQGADFKTNIPNQTAVNITTNSLVVHDAANNLITNLAGAGITVNYSGDTLIVNGLKNGYHLDFGTDTSMDRFTVQNITSQSNRSFDLGDIRFTVTSTTGENTEVGSHIKTEDDGPFISTPAGGHVAFADGASLTQDTLADPGVDGGLVKIDFSTLIIPTGFSSTLSLDGQHLTIKDASNVDIYQLDVTATNYTFTVLQDEPPAFFPLNFAAIPSGSPQETLTVNATGTSTNITFDGIDFTGTGPIDGATGTVFSSFANPGAASTVDDLNPDAVGFGEKGGQASQMNQNEGFLAFDASHAAMSGLKFDIQGVGGVKSVNVEWWLLDSTNHIIDNGLDHFTNLPSGNNVVTETIDTGDTFDHMLVRFFYDNHLDTSGVRVENFEVHLPNPTPDREVDFTLGITDGDGDVIHTNLVTLFVDA